MKIALLASVAGTAGAIAVSRSSPSQQLCSSSSFQEGGNWYCQPVSHITYQNVGTSSQYNDVVNMDQQTGACQFQPNQFSGPLAPFNEPMSLHFRGPLILRQLAVYMPSAERKRDEGGSENLGDIEGEALKNHAHSHGHVHGHAHKHLHQHPHHPERVHETEKEKRACPLAWVTATIDGQIQSWINDYCPGYETAAPTPAPSPVESNAPVAAEATTAPSSPPPSTAPQAGGSSGSKAKTGQAFSRTGYYHARHGTAQGLTFLGNYGGQGSGKWTSAFGNTLSYVNAEGSGGAVQSTVLANTTIPSSGEVIVMTDQPCSSDRSCGYVQDGSVAYKGFDGADKTFLLEFSMPHGSDPDTPAVWMLNARIPLTSQYGACNCWGSGCGEFDVFEVLSPGSTKAKSTFHSVNGGGDSNYFERPVEDTIRVAVVYDSASESVSVKVLEGLGVGGKGDFPASLTAQELQGLMRDDSLQTGGLGSSSFRLQPAQ